MDKQTFDKLVLVLGFDGAMELAQSVQAPMVAKVRAVPRREKLDIPMLKEMPANVIEAVAACLATTSFIPWSAAHKILFMGDFRSANINTIIAAFEAVRAGASALIVDDRGYHNKKVATRHAAWLAANGYGTTLPGRK